MPETQTASRTINAGRIASIPRDDFFGSHPFCAILFAEILKTSMPVVQKNHSDLYHDANSIHAIVERALKSGEETRFAHLAYEYGTSFCDSDVMLRETSKNFGLEGSVVSFVTLKPGVDKDQTPTMRWTIETSNSPETVKQWEAMLPEFSGATGGPAIAEVNN